MRPDSRDQRALRSDASVSYSERVRRRGDDEPARHLDAGAGRQIDELRVEIGPLPIVARVERPIGDGVGVGGILAEAGDEASLDGDSPRGVESLARHEALGAPPVERVADGELLQRLVCRRW